MRASFVVSACLALLCASGARAQDGGVSDEDAGPEPDPGPAAVAVDGKVQAGPAEAADPSLPSVPSIHSFKTVPSFSGKLGASAVWIDVEPYGFRTGYGQLFTQADVESIGGSGIGLHWDLDLRTNLFEPRDPCVLDPVTNTYARGPDGACLIDEKNVALNMYRTVGVVPTGRHNDWLRIDRLSMSWSNEWLSVGGGRMFIDAAAQAQVDGVDVSLSFGPVGRVGVFGGFKPNPWHPQVVGAASGGAILNLGDREYVPPLWGTLEQDPNYAFGAYGNELVAIPGLPWLRVGSLRFFTAGGYTSLRLGPFTTDLALVGDLFDFAPDRVWGFTSGAVRLLDNMTVAWRTSVDLVGARPLLPSQAFLDWTWRALGPFTLSATYAKINTTATALSYARFFRPLEDPQGTLDARPEQPLQDARAQSGVNNTAVYVVDRDRVLLEVSVEVGPSLQVYAEGELERRADRIFTPLDPAAGLARAGDGWAQLGQAFTCQYAKDDPAAPQSINPLVDVELDLCRYGGSLGLRDPFLGGAGSFDLSFTHLNGAFSSSNRVQGRIGVQASDLLWIEAGAALEMNTSERVYVGTLGAEQPVDPNLPPPVDPRHQVRALNVYLVDGAATLFLWEGLALEAAYLAFLEDVPFQGDTNPGGAQAAFARRDPRQLVQTIFSRLVWRF